MATVTEEAAPAVAAEKVDEVKEAPKPEEGEAPRAEEGQEGKKAEDGEGTKAEKKPRKRKPKSAGPHHPPYFEMIKEAILAQAVDDGKSGSSPYAIAKYIGESHRDVLPTNYRKVLSVQLRSFAAKGRLVKVKASFKLAPAEEKKAAAAAKNKKPAAAKRNRTARAAATKKPEEAKKARAKRARKAAPAPKPKQHKSVRRAAVGRKANMASA